MLLTAHGGLFSSVVVMAISQMHGLRLKPCCCLFLLVLLASENQIFPGRPVELTEGAARAPKSCRWAVYPFIFFQGESSPGDSFCALIRAIIQLIALIWIWPGQPLRLGGPRAQADGLRGGF